VVPPERWPTFVRFTDLADKSKARIAIPDGQNYRLSPSTPHETMAALGGRVADVAVEMTDAEPAREIERVVPWIGELSGARGGLEILAAPTDPLHARIEERHLLMKGYVR